AGARTSAPTSSLDVARTVLDALGLAPPAALQGVSFLDTASGDAMASARPVTATSIARFALRWGSFVLSGPRDRETKLCDLSLEPACVTDVRAAYPFAHEAMHRAALDVAARTPAKPAREPAILDSNAQIVLKAWGRPPEKKEKKREEVDDR